MLAGLRRAWRRRADAVQPGIAGSLASIEGQQSFAYRGLLNKRGWGFRK